jgi:hypothetical protein
LGWGFPSLVRAVCATGSAIPQTHCKCCKVCTHHILHCSSCFATHSTSRLGSIRARPLVELAICLKGKARATVGGGEREARRRRRPSVWPRHRSHPLPHWVLFRFLVLFRWAQCSPLLEAWLLLPRLPPGFPPTPSASARWQPSPLPSLAAWLPFPSPFEV